MKQNDDLRIVDNDLYLGMLKELLLDQGKEVSILVSGGSMTPFLIHQRDKVLLSPVSGPLKRGDVVMYQRDDGLYVLHRIVRLQKDGKYVLCGDAQIQLEPNVCREQIFARVSAIERKGTWIGEKSIFWWFFMQVWSRVIPARHLLMKMYSFVKRS